MLKDFVIDPIKSLPAQLNTVLTLVEAGLIRPTGPLALVKILDSLRQWGLTQAAAVAVNAARWPNEPAVVDDDGEVTFAELAKRTNALARGLGGTGIEEGDRVALVARNSRTFVETVIGSAKLGADVLFLNTSHAAPQTADVLAAQEPTAIIYDGEFTDLVARATEGLDIIRLRIGPLPEDAEQDIASGRIEDLIENYPSSDPKAPSHHGKVVVLTSGTTGRPKGASRQRPSTLDPVADFLDSVPLRARTTIVIAPPLYHALAYSQFEFAGALGMTMLVSRKFDPERTLQLIERRQARALTVVPVMLKRILDLPKKTLDKYDCSSLEIVLSSGAALPHDLAARFMDRFGPCVYNLYGATELGWVTIAGPADLLEAPGTVGRPVRGTRFAVLDDEGEEVPPGRVGNLFVTSDLVFEGYTDRALDRKVIRGMMSVGDLGHVDEDGRVFVDSREDDMIVSGGENVYPGEVAELLSEHPEIEDVAVYGVDDPDFGQVLTAFVVKSKGSKLDVASLRKYVGENLARFKVPKHVLFCDSLPRSATGKVVKKDLLKRFETKKR